MVPYYARPGTLTQADDRLGDLPGNVARLCSIIQGLMLHPAEARHYGIRLTRARWKELELRDISAKLNRLEKLFPAPVDQQRPPSKLSPHYPIASSKRCCESPRILC
jgi:hypothetical protein